MANVCQHHHQDVMGSANVPMKVMKWGAVYATVGTVVLETVFPVHPGVMV